MTDIKSTFSSELKSVFKYINDITIKYPTDTITIEYFIMAILDKQDCDAYKILNRTMLSNPMAKLKEKITTILQNSHHTENEQSKYCEDYDNYFADTEISDADGKMKSIDFLLTIIKKNDEIRKLFKNAGVSYDQLKNSYRSFNEKNSKTRNKAQTKKSTSPTERGETEAELHNLTTFARRGKLNFAYGNEKIYEKIFAALSKRNNNNVIIVGEHGVGKTTTAYNIANLLVSEDIPDNFRGKQLMLLDLVSLQFTRGMMEVRFNNIMIDAIKRNKYIFLIDDLGYILSDKAHFGDVQIDKMIARIFEEESIMVIGCVTPSEFSRNISKNPLLMGRFEKITLEEKTIDETIDILKEVSVKYGGFHGVNYTEGCLKACATYSKRYMSNAVLPHTAINLLDEAGARKKLTIRQDKEVVKLEERLNEIIEEKNTLEGVDAGERFDKLTKEEISIKSNINKLMKQNSLNGALTEVTENDVMELISDKTTVPVSEITDNELAKLVNLEGKLNEMVIGQEEAVKTVSRTVKRNRVGISNPNKPSVMMFVGKSGTGKTYLAKKLSEIVFGNDKSFVRLDMSEYGDKTSITKLYGSSPGYIGYENGGILTESIKKNNHCVLLLDEIEKATEEVHDVFLQLFDEGRLTDNTGGVVDFSNVIIIMTSNVGTKEAMIRGGGVGFLKDGKNYTSIVNRAIKDKFKPEFINRIDSIVMFNDLNEDNLKTIVRLEVNKLNDRVKLAGYEMDEAFINEAIEIVYNKLSESDNEGFGARPILRLIQSEVEDRITDYIIEKRPQKGEKLTKEILNKMG